MTCLTHMSHSQLFRQATDHGLPTSRVKQQSSTLLQQQSRRKCCFPPWLNQTLTLLPTCARWTLLLTSTRSICFLESFNFTLYIFQVAQNIFNHPITMLMKCCNLLAKCPNIHWHNVSVGSIELSQRVPAECHAAGAWYTQERVQLNNCIVPSWHWFDPCWFCTVASPGVFVSIEWICALYWNSLPCTDSSTLRAMRLGVSHPKNVRLKGTQIWINTSNSIQGWNPSKPFSKRWIFETSRYISMHQRT